MDKTISVSLSGHDEQFRVEEAGYDRLARYLERAETRLQDDPDRAEVVRDLERSIGDRLAAADGPPDRLISATEIDDVLDAIGAVDTGRADEPEDAASQPRRRRLMRIREGQQLAGVCNGLAAYSEIRVDWVRTIFVFAALVTAGLFLVVYIAMAFILPVAETREAVS
jgi:phage shock protein PspC (stress-responsive transcriptional regulator)